LSKSGGSEARWEGDQLGAFDSKEKGDARFTFAGYQFDAHSCLSYARQLTTGILCDPSVTGEERQAAQKALGMASNLLDKSEKYLPR